MAGFRVDLEQLDDVVARLGALVGFVEQHLDDLEARVAKLPTVWAGLAATAQAEAHRSWDEGARDLRDGIETMRAAAQKAREDYAAAVAANLAMLNGSSGS